MSCNVFPPTAGTHDITYGDYITAHHRWPAILSIWVYECVRTEYGKCNVSDTPAVCRSVARDCPSPSRTHAELSTRAISLVHHAQGGLHVLLETFIRPFLGEVQCVVLWGRRGGQCASQTRLHVCEGIPPLTPKTARKTGGSSSVRTKTIRFNIVFQSWL